MKKLLSFALVACFLAMTGCGDAPKKDAPKTTPPAGDKPAEKK